MKKLMLLVFTAIVTLVLSACSYSVNFVLINESDSVLEVEYTFVNYYSTPSKMSLTEWNKWFGENNGGKFRKTSINLMPKREDSKRR